MVATIVTPLPLLIQRSGVMVVACFLTGRKLFLSVPDGCRFYGGNPPSDDSTLMAVRGT